MLIFATVPYIKQHLHEGGVEVTVLGILEFACSKET